MKKKVITIIGAVAIIGLGLITLNSSNERKELEIKNKVLIEQQEEFKTKEIEKQKLEDSRNELKKQAEQYNALQEFLNSTSGDR